MRGSLHNRNVRFAHLNAALMMAADEKSETHFVVINTISLRSEVGSSESYSCIVWKTLMSGTDFVPIHHAAMDIFWDLLGVRIEK